MELILLLCSSGVAGLFTYIYLDYLSIFDTEKPEIKKMFSVLFALISVGVFILIFYLIGYIHMNIILNTLFSFIISIILIEQLNKFVYPYIINKFRNSMNRKRDKQNLSKLSDKHPIDEILDTAKYKFYVEYYTTIENSEPLTTGELIFHSIDENDEINFVISPTPKIKDTKIIDDIYIYQKSNSSNYYKIYAMKINK